MTGPMHCGRKMLAVKDSNSNAPIWWCVECHSKMLRMPRVVAMEVKDES